MTPMPNPRRGFSLAEVTLVSALMAVLALLLSSAWRGVGRNAASLVGRSQLVQERDLAVASLCRDVGGCLVDPSARSGEKAAGRWLSWAVANNATLASNQDLTLTYDGGTVIRYFVAADPDPGVLTLIFVRRKTVGGTTTDFTVARNVLSMHVTPNPVPSGGADVNLVLCFAYGLDKQTGAPGARTLTLTCDLTVKQPSAASDQALPWSLNHYSYP